MAFQGNASTLRAVRITLVPLLTEEEKTLMRRCLDAVRRGMPGFTSRQPQLHQTSVGAAALIPHMLAAFIERDRGFHRALVAWPAGWAACAAIAWGDGLSGLAQFAACDVCLDLVDEVLRDIGCRKVALPGGQHAMGGGADLLQQVFAHPVVQSDTCE